MSKKFLLTGIATTLLLFLLNAVAYVAFLKNFFQSHPVISSEFMKQLYKPDSEIIWWATVLSAIAIGFLVTTVIHWSNARTFLTGIRAGFVFSILLLCGVDFGLLASTNSFSTASAFADIITSTTMITLSGAVAAWLLGRGKI